MFKNLFALDFTSNYNCPYKEYLYKEMFEVQFKIEAHLSKKMLPNEFKH